MVSKAFVNLAYGLLDKPLRFAILRSSYTSLFQM